MKKHIQYLLSATTLLCVASAVAQPIDLRKLPKAEREKYLLELSYEMVMTYGPDFYFEGVTPIITEKTFQTEDRRPIIARNIGRQYYEVAYPYDSKVEWIKQRTAAEVWIWCDTGEPLLAGVDGSGYTFFEKPYIRAKTRSGPDPDRPQIRRTYEVPKE